MNPDVFFENFELLTDAPNGVQKLRELILQLTVRGKLVPQDPNDEPASVLIEKIKAEKKELVKGNNGRNSKASINIISDEIFDIPSHWIWTKLGNLGITQTGTTPSKSEPKFFGNFISFIKPADMSESGVKYDNEMLSELGLNSGRLIPKNSVLMVCIGGSIGKTCLVDRNVSCNQQINAISPFSSVDCKFITFVFKSRYFQDQVLEKASIGTLPIINKSKWEQISVPLPPLAEQKRIVTKVDELMTLCDKLEARRQKKQEIQSKLNSAALDKMLSAENQEEFERYWQRLCENFDLLYDNPENVEKLRQAILKAGVEGKLTQQWRKKHPDVEPARSLLSKIKEKKKNSEIEKNRRSKQLKLLDETELSTLPENWEWTRLDSIADIKGGITKDGKRKVEDGREVPYLRVANVQRGYLDLDEIKYIEASETVISELSLKYGDVLFTEGGDLDKLGRGWIWQNELPECIHQNHIFRARLYSEKIISKFVSWFANTHYQYFMDEGKQTTNLASINLTKLRGFLLPLPPYEEQKCIVEKVEQLMGLCDQLKSKLKKEREDNEKLMEAVVKGLLEGAVAEKTELDKPIPLQAAVVKLK
ncbi:restriction endonuclease subunit S [Methanosarcina sp.]|uniref:restriction endonuclease subunit S n=1 Tax=Methanosarcina sp. TaxID=2213 RepID=UPI003C75E52B